MNEEQDKEFFEKLANFSKENNSEENEDYEIKFAKSNSNLAQKINIEKDYDYEESEFDGAEGQLAIDVYQTEDDIVIESAIAGVDPEDLDINVTNDSVTIRGKRKHSEGVEKRNYLYQECFWGKFSRSIILPQEIDPDKATVHFKNGVLKIKLPKLSRKKVRKLKVKIE
ncbi:MAG: Hsp20/alpha crystallin family protein [Minisyncoccia bacterium]